MRTNFLFYLCPFCFKVCEDCQDCHERQMVRCDAGQPGAERRKPVVDASDRLQSRAPRWFLEAVGWIPAGYSPGVARGGA